MGAPGLLSRTHYPAFGSAWTYVAGDAELATAPGQLDWERAQLFGIPARSSASFLALIGGEQVMLSPGPHVYNQLLDEMIYLPIVTRSLSAALPLLEDLGALGLSVTMPHKLEALVLSKPDALGHALGAVNTMRRDDDGWRSTNSDVAGVREPLRNTTAFTARTDLGFGRCRTRRGRSVPAAEDRRRDRGETASCRRGVLRRGASVGRAACGRSRCADQRHAARRSVGAPAGGRRRVRLGHTRALVGSCPRPSARWRCGCIRAPSRCVSSSAMTPSPPTDSGGCSHEDRSADQQEHDAARAHHRGAVRRHDRHRKAAALRRLALLVRGDRSARLPRRTSRRSLCGHLCGAHASRGADLLWQRGHGGSLWVMPVAARGRHAHDRR